MESTTIQKYQKATTASLKKRAQTVFNAWIRERDKNLPCINCGKFTTLQAGHFFPTSTFGHLRFNEDNVNGECVSCNYFNSQSHSYGYRPNLIKKIGQERFDKLEQLANIKQYNKLDRYFLIEILNRYK